MALNGEPEDFQEFIDENDFNFPILAATLLFAIEKSSGSDAEARISTLCMKLRPY